MLGEHLPLADPSELVDRVLRSITDLGPLTDLLARRDVEEIFIEGPRVSYLDGSGRLRGLTVPTSEDENRQVIERMLAPTDRQLNAKHPLVQARVLGGSARLTAAIPPIGDQLSATVRRYVVRNVTLDDLVARDSMSAPAATFLHRLMQLRSRVTISGEPGAGKTTLLAALLAAAPAHHCVRACEEIRELAVPVTHGSYYEVRPPALDGTGEITLRDLVKFVLAMRPDRIVVGEVRGAEAFELSRAVNAGCGFLCTVHANSASEALDALVNAALMAGENVTERIVRKVFSESLDVVVHLDRDDASGEGDTVGRRVAEIAAVVPALRDDFTVEPLFVRDDRHGALRWTGALPPSLASRLDRVRDAGTRDVLAAAGGEA
jgi:pilus assembly protein CpaF